MQVDLLGISKNFPGILANDGVNLTIKPGEIHALLGENGAGKTTLMNLLIGLYQSDAGEIKIDGRSVQIHNPSDAIKYGIGMVHQHFMLVPIFSVTENVILGIEETPGLSRLDLDKAKKRIVEISTSHGLEVDPDSLIEELPVGVQQRVEIIKALYRDCELLILDEPTAVLTPQEVSDLFRVLLSLKSRGTSIIFISHKLNEVLEISDRITVMRRGKVVGERTPSETNAFELASLMVGREVNLQVVKQPAKPGNPVLHVIDLVVVDENKHHLLDNISFTVHSGEIVVVAGVQGNGQTELVETLIGLRKVVNGSITVCDNICHNIPTRDIYELGVSYVPEDRRADGLVSSFSISNNLILNNYYKTPFSHKYLLNLGAIQNQSKKLVADYDIRTPSPNYEVGKLSGGNQQKVVIAREFSHPIKLLIAAQPTRGLDVGSIEYIHNRIVQLRDTGAAILIVSTEIDEVLSLADRILVFYKGKIAGELLAESATTEQLGMLMGGSQID